MSADIGIRHEDVDALEGFRVLQDRLRLSGTSRGAYLEAVAFEPLVVRDA